MSDPGPTVTVRYWAAARAAAGVDEEPVTARTLHEALTQVKARRREPRFAQIVDHCAILHGETPVGARDHHEVLLADGDVLELLPPFAGG